MTATAPTTRDQILDAFADQLATVGFAGISLVGVARTAGIQKPSMYHHFPGGKEEIYTSVALRFIDDLGSRVQAAVTTDGDLADRLVALAQASAGRTARTISFEERIYDALDHVAQPTRDLVSQRYVDGVLAPVTGLFARAVENGEVSGAPELLMNAFLHMARATDLMRTPDDAQRIVDLFLNGARTR
ncbi:TetR/AcrR family transcriptional regulator [Isoptericola sp. NPDC019693]|uniref:TetR/AcrR family transcriptional regulator n=1 Tax=Isoptericola sp. NPDC019693 TaxID=3364009 RepID=UPI00378FCA54